MQQRRRWPDPTTGVLIDHSTPNEPGPFRDTNAFSIYAGTRLGGTHAQLSDAPKAKGAPTGAGRGSGPDWRLFSIDGRRRGDDDAT